jgi:predicted TIM-barrel fold metal-dependent hydrolase
MFQKPDWRIIDMHTHQLEQVRPPLPRNPDLRANPLTSHYTWHEHNGDLLVQEMNVAGVKQALVKTYEAEDLAIALKRFGMNPAEFQTGEDYMLPWVRKHPERLIWAAVFNPTRTDRLPEWKRRIEGAELKAVVFRPPFFPRNPINDGTHRQLLEWCGANQKPVMMTFEGIVPPETPDQSAYLALFKEVVSGFPKVRFCLMHMGFDELAQLSRVPMFRVVNELNEKHGNVWFETAMHVDYTYPYRGYLEKVHTLYEAVGRDRIMWGTDWPWTESWSKYFQHVQCILENAHFLSQDEKKLFLGENAAKFLAI